MGLGYAYAYYIGAWNSYQQKKYIDAKLFLLQLNTRAFPDEFDFRNSLENKIYSLLNCVKKPINNLFSSFLSLLLFY